MNGKIVKNNSNINHSAQPSDWGATVGKVDDAYGDRNLVCSCNPIEDYAEI